MPEESESHGHGNSSCRLHPGLCDICGLSVQAGPVGAEEGVGEDGAASARERLALQSPGSIAQGSAMVFNLLAPLA